MYVMLEKWLSEHGGPAIRLRLSALHNASRDSDEVINVISTLLAIDEVHSILNLLDGFNTPARDKKTLEHLIHYYKETCIENFFPLIMDLGFRAGIPIFDEKMIPVMNVFNDMYAGLAGAGYTLNLHRFFFYIGYYIP